MSSPNTTATKAAEVTFGVTGMTCASCVRRIEKALGKAVGVLEASGNLATEKARVAYDPALVTPEQLQTAVEQAGYGMRDMPTATTPVAIAQAQTNGRVNSEEAVAMSSVSVVTNALRLRGFRRPASAEEIPHPPLGERAREYDYLASIVVAAFAADILALIGAQTNRAIPSLGPVAIKPRTSVRSPSDVRRHPDLPQLVATSA